MKVKELIEALQKVDNQDAIVIFTDGEGEHNEIIEKNLEVSEAKMYGWPCTWNEETKTHDKGITAVVDLR